MADTELQFRTATFGGFQKQDVLQYIETVTQEHREKLEALQRQLAEAGEARSALEGELAASRAETGAREEELRALREELDEAHRAAEEQKLELSLLEEGLEDARKKLTDAETRLAETEGRLARALPAAESYEKVKDRTAGIELEAHCRAQAVEAAALVQVDKARRELEQWVVRVQAGYDQLRTEVEATLSHASGELEKVQRTMVGVTAELDQRDGDLKALMRTYEEAIGPQMPDPLPLEEPEKKSK